MSTSNCLITCSSCPENKMRGVKSCDMMYNHNFNMTEYNYKSVPLQAWSGPEGSRKLRFPDFVTTAQDGGKVVSPTHQPPLSPGNTPGTHLLEAELTPGP